MQRFIAALALLFLVQSASTMATEATSPDSEKHYNSLKTKELSVQFRDPVTDAPVVGSSIFEKGTSEIKCRKFGAVVPNPTYTYECYKKGHGEFSAEAKYAEMPVNEFRVIYSDAQTGRPRIGTKIFEKSDDSYLCQKISAVVPNPVPWYACYQKI